MCTPFMFDPDEFERVKREWEDLQEQIEHVGRRFRTVNQIMSVEPSDDPATSGFVHRARRALDAAQTSNGALHDYARAYLSLLEATRREYTERDEDNALAMKSVDPTS